jgi:hypothetical protein
MEKLHPPSFICYTPVIGGLMNKPIERAPRNISKGGSKRLAAAKKSGRGILSKAAGGGRISNATAMRAQAALEGNPG